ncbi:hypothetical protein TCON_0460 [Astathelohania contejeani]|uniref:Uncharacterized protein n=1 Tax=Astathelohania contejeani TaxID=164912 RepID=A0ABQ7I1N2_9MICR|nr:hypothetical protein TCON_0460 [Thelohania contejeani]
MKHLKREITKHTLLLAVANYELITNQEFFYKTHFSIIGILLGLVPLNSKSKYHIANTFLLIAVLFHIPIIFAIAYGFLISSIHSAIALLCLTEFRSDNFRCCLQVECIGFLFGLFVNMNKYFVLPIHLLLYYNTHRLISPPLESNKLSKETFFKEVYEKLSRLLGKRSYIPLSTEYRKIVEFYYKKEPWKIQDLAVYYPLHCFLIPVFTNIPQVYKIAFLVTPWVPTYKSSSLFFPLVVCLIFKFYLLAVLFAFFTRWPGYEECEDKYSIIFNNFLRFVFCIIFIRIINYGISLK